MTGRFARALAFGALLGLAACAPRPPQPPEASCLEPAFSRKTDALLDAWLEETPAWGRAVGLHAYDGRVPSMSREALARRVRWLDDTIRSLKCVTEWSLGPEDRLDRALLLGRLRLERENLAGRRLPENDPRFYEELFDVSGYVNFEYAPLTVRATRLVEHEERALAEVPRITENLAPVLSRPVVSTAIRVYRGYAEYLRGDVASLVRKIEDPALVVRFERANEALARASDELAKRLESEWLPRANDTAHVLGAERYLAFVAAQEGRAVDLDAFSRMAEADLAANKAAYEALAPTVTITRPKATELVAEATRLMNASRDFLVEKRLVTLPSEDRAVVEVSPPYMRWNAAFLNMPGPFDNVQRGFYYVTLPDPSWPAKEQEEYVFPYGTLLATTVHEVYPGHFLQGLWLRRAPTRVQRMTDSYSFVEGWAHYVEELMVAEGFGGNDPQNRLGQLSDALLRNCRFVVSIGVHARGMSLAEAERRFVEDCHQDRAGAREQAVRATFDPGYFAYTLGKLQIRELRREAEARFGARFELRAFHDALLSHGSPPVALVRERVLADLEAKLPTPR
jgi:uncharacterized protein (DUF885 family)